jgi:hypothetical protein
MTEKNTIRLLLQTLAENQSSPSKVKAGDLVWFGLRVTVGSLDGEIDRTGDGPKLGTCKQLLGFVEPHFNLTL